MRNEKRRSTISRQSV